MTEKEGGFGDLYIWLLRQKFRDGETSNASCVEGKLNRVKSIRTDPRKEDKMASGRLYLFVDDLKAL